MVCHSLAGMANTQDSLRPLDYGQKVPDFELTGVINNANPSIRFAELEGKLVILDFMGTWCGSCIPYVPRLDSLKHAFEGQVEVVILCHDWDHETVRNFIDKKWGHLNLQLPFALVDQQNQFVNNLFPHRMVSHMVWIAPDGTYLYSTGAKEVTSANIQKVLNGEPLNVRLKQDQVQFDKNRPIFEQGHLKDLKPLLGKTAFSHYIPGISGMAGQEVDSAAGIVRRYYTQTPLSDLYNSIARFRGIGNNRIIWKIDSANIFFPTIPSDEWMDKNTYCMEVTLPLQATDDDWAHYYLHTLNVNLRHHSRFDSISIPCYAVVVSPGRDSSVIMSKGGGRGMKYDATKTQKNYSNMPIDQVIAGLNSENGPIIINESGITGTVDLRVPISISSLADIPKLRACLIEQGLDLVEVRRNLEHLIVDDAYPSQRALLR